MSGVEKRKLNVIFTKSGTGSATTKLSIPISWCFDMGLDVNNRGVEVEYNYDTKEITIKQCIK